MPPVRPIWKMKTALVVDDEASDLDALEQALTAAGYDVLTASDGNGALAAGSHRPSRHRRGHVTHDGD